MLQNLTQHKYYPVLLYVIALTGALALVNYLHYLPQLPGGEHFWRQTDSGSFVTYYYEHGMNFFEPGTYNLKPSEGKSASEFPILYYITAALWHLFGRSEATLKIIDSIILFAGFYCFFKIAHKQTGNIYTALLISMLLLSSPMLLSYANNFLPDPPALGFTFIGLYFFFLFTEKNKYPLFFWSIIFFSLASLIKVSFAIAPATILSLIILERIFSIKINSTEIFSGNIFKYLMPIILMFTCIAAWTIWALNYNKINNSQLFLTSTNPYWDASAENLKDINSMIVNYWQRYYYYFTTLHVFATIILFGLILIPKWNKLAIWLSLLFVGGSIMYGLLFYRQFGPHDYYMILFILPVAFLVLFSFSTIQKLLQQYTQLATPILIIGLLSLNVLSYIYAAKKIAMHKSKDPSSVLFKHPDLVSGKLEQFGIPKNGIVYSFPDCSPNGSLYLLQRKGYTDWHSCDSTDVPNNLKQLIPKGAEYLIIHKPEYYKYANSEWFEAKLVGQCQTIKFYQVTHYDTTKWNRAAL